MKNTKLYKVIITILITAIGIQGFSFYITQDVWSGGLLLCVFLPVLFVLSFSFCGVRGRAILILIPLLGIAAVFLLSDKEFLFRFIPDFFRWVTGVGEWNMEWLLGYHMAAMAGVSLGLALFSTAVERLPAVKYSFCALLILWMGSSLVRGEELQKLTVCLVLICLALFCVEFVQDRIWKHGKESDVGKRIIVWLLPFFLLYFLLVLATPVRQEPYDWQFVKSLMDELEKIRILADQKLGNSRRDGFGISFIGFSESGQIGGDTSSKDRAELMVQADHELRTNLYLTGRVFDSFADNEWYTVYQEDEWDYQMDFMETLYAIYRHDPEQISDYVRTAGISVEYRELSSRYLFAPLKTWYVKSDRQEVSYAGGEFLFEKQKGLGTAYSISFMQMNLDHPKFYEMILAESNWQYNAENDANQELLRELGKKYLKNASITVTEDELAAYSRRMEEIYLDKPVLSGEVVIWLDEITADCENDIEVLKAIERELKKYTYTFTPGEIPGDKEFLDYFLLETREGYCTYFATAFVLLARAEGIPARYVQGFSVPVDRKSLSRTTVWSGMAHAWPEVYMQGVGWIPFEPTPDYGSIRYQPWKVTESSGQNGNMESVMAGIEEQADYDILTGIPEAEPAWPEETVIRDNSYNHILRLVLVILAIGIILIFILDYLMKRYRYRRLSPAGKLNAVVSQNLLLLGYLGFSLKEGGTLEELAVKIKESGKLSWIPLAFIPLYEEVRYGCRDAEEIMEAVSEERQLLLIAVRSRDKLKYIRFRIKAGI